MTDAQSRRALVLVAHPDPDSFTHAAARAAVTGLQRGGWHVDEVDLYEIGFRAAMSMDERRAYHGDDPILDPLVAEQAELVQRAEALVFVYPMWWSGLPAILKGWLDRVLVPGVGFTFHERTGKVRPGLRNVRRIVGITSSGSSRLVVNLINDNGRRKITRGMRLTCGLRARSLWLPCYGIDRADDDDRRRYLERVGRRMERL